MNAAQREDVPRSPVRSAHILLVEDSENDALLTRKVFQSIHPTASVAWVRNGQDCLAYLRKRQPFSTATTPDLILLDVNMPGMQGSDVLEAIISDPELSLLPVVALSTSSDPQDIQRMYRLRCSGYIVKPMDFVEFCGVLRSVGEYWFSTAAPVRPPLAI